MKARISREERLHGSIQRQGKQANNKRKGSAFRVSSIDIVGVGASRGHSEVFKEALPEVVGDVIVPSCLENTVLSGGTMKVGLHFETSVIYPGPGLLPMFYHRAKLHQENLRRRSRAYERFLISNLGECRRKLGQY